MNKAQQGTMFREEAIARVWLNNAEFVSRAVFAVRVVTRRCLEFTTDDVWAECDRMNIGCREPRAMGAAMRAARAADYITPTNRWRLSERPQCHRRPVRVWRAQCECRTDGIEEQWKPSSIMERVMDNSQCRSCNAPIIWAKSEMGKAMPLDAELVLDGNVVVVKEVARVETGPERKKRMAAGGKAFMSHFATCPQSKKWRK